MTNQVKTNNSSIIHHRFGYKILLVTIILPLIHHHRPHPAAPLAAPWQPCWCAKEMNGEVVAVLYTQRIHVPQDEPWRTKVGCLVVNQGLRLVT